MDLTVRIYEVTKSFPRDERFRLVDQLTRCAASVPANIAEGSARNTAREYARFLSVAKGSLMEAETFLQLALRLGYVDAESIEDVVDLVVQISNMLTALRAKFLDSDV